MLASLFFSSSSEEEVVGDGVVSPKYAARFFSASASVRAAEFSTEDRTSSAVETSELFSLDSPFFPALAKIESTSSVIGSKIASSSTVAPSTVSSASLETSSGISAPPPPPKSFFTFSAAASSSLIASLSSSSSSFSLFLSLLVFFFLLDDEEDLDFFPPESEEKSSASALRNNLSNLSNLPSPSFFIYSLTESTVSSWRLLYFCAFFDISFIPSKLILAVSTACLASSIACWRSLKARSLSFCACELAEFNLINASSADFWTSFAACEISSFSACNRSAKAFLSSLIFEFDLLANSPILLLAIASLFACSKYSFACCVANAAVRRASKILSLACSIKRPCASDAFVAISIFFCS